MSQVLSAGTPHGDAHSTAVWYVALGIFLMSSIVLALVFRYFKRRADEEEIDRFLEEHDLHL